MPDATRTGYAFHPFIQTLVDAFLGANPFAEPDALAIRAANNPAARELFGPPQAVALAEERGAEHDGLAVPVRVYEPVAAPLPGTLVYFHGGGFVVGSAEVWDSVCRNIALGAGCRVVSADYRLAPEHPFPAAVHDAYAATAWAARAFPGSLAVGGDSAGGTLAIAACLLARQRGGPRIGLQALAYPACDLSSFATESYARFGHDLFLTTGAMTFFRDCWLPRPEDRINPLASPLLAEDLTGLPPCLLLAAEYDALLDEGEAYAARLRAAGIPCARTIYPGMIHGFFAMHPLGARDNGLDEYCAALRAAFADKRE